MRSQGSRQADRALVALAAACLTLSCQRDGHGAAATAPSASAEPSSSAAKTLIADAPACASRRAAVLALPREPGAPDIDATRAELVGRVRGAAVLWRRRPRASDAHDELTDRVRALDTSKRPVRDLRGLVQRYRGKPAALRAAFLREGYLVAPRVDLALALVEQVKLTDPFDEPVVYLLRRGLVHKLVRTSRDRLHPDRYVHEDGPFRRETAEILLADRLGLDPDSLRRDQLSIDLRPAVEASGFDRVRALHWAGESLAAEVRFGHQFWVRALFDLSGPSPRLVCLDVDPAQAALVAEARARDLRDRRVLARIREVVDEQVREQLPFDAPKGGGGDADDRFPLMPRWESAYRASMRTFEYQGRRYDVYDVEGRPLAPQVCIEFVFDTWERAAGTGWAPMRRANPESPWEPHPGRIEGTLRVSDLGLARPRHFLSFVNCFSFRIRPLVVLFGPAPRPAARLRVADSALEPIEAPREPPAASRGPTAASPPVLVPSASVSAEPTPEPPAIDLAAPVRRGFTPESQASRVTTSKSCASSLHGAFMPATSTIAGIAPSARVWSRCASGAAPSCEMASALPPGSSTL